MKQRLIAIIATLVLTSAAFGERVSVCSPDKNLKATVTDAEGKLMWAVSYEGIQVVLPSQLGLETSIMNLSEGLHIVDSTNEVYEKQYLLNHAKCSEAHFLTSHLVVDVENSEGCRFSVEFMVGNHDIAFRYLIPRQKEGKYKRVIIEKELTAFRLPNGTTAFLCPQIGPETGWERTKPSYEEEYEVDMPMDNPSKYGQGYTFPCLFKVSAQTKGLGPTGNAFNGSWVLIGETGVGSNYCGSHLSDYQPGVGYRIAFPHEGENGGFGSVSPAISLPGETPWRTITIDTTLKGIVETTIPYDVVEPLYEPSRDYRPGRYTWSWLIWQDNSINYDDQVRFIDLASAMGYEYCLVDNLWDERIGRDRMENLCRYAKSKNVELMLWYNSNGHWNDAPQSPRNLMNTSVAREREMAWLERIGVKGIKVDFFGGDKQETMRLYEDILSDANRHGLQVIFHGCTLPRGWERMYPNFIGSEAVLASENVFFTDYHANREGFELTLHPFIRNAYASMDWGGVIMNRFLSKDNHSRHARKTSDVFEMATGVTNQCAVNCVALQPNNLDELPVFELDFLRRLPTRWDETRFLEGYPGKYILLARRHDNRWIVVGLNGTDQPMRLELNLSELFTSTDNLLIYNDYPRKKGDVVPVSYCKPFRLNGKGKALVTLQPMGGFIVERKDS